MTLTLGNQDDIDPRIILILDKKQYSPTMRTLFAVQNENFADFVKMYTTDSLRKNFINMIIKFVRAKNIAGVKIDVQPAEGGNKEKFTQLFKELMLAFLAESARTRRQRLVLSAGIPSDKTFLDKYYDVLAISKYVDMVDLATHYFDSPSNAASPEHHSPLYRKDPSSTKTIDFMARYVSGKGVRKDKINIGLSFMSITYDRNRGNSNYVRFPWFFSFPVVCSYLTYDGVRQSLEPEKGRVVDYDKMNNVYWSKANYDDPDTLRAKVLTK
ncbi:Endochitinase 1 [Bulinus truncatus]|nr:Endochitinase 1 [Bulinus truncatus]